MSEAQDTVMSAPDLLELILSRLSMCDLLTTAPLVSKMWQALTFTPALQRALFLQPDHSYGAERVQNPLLVKNFPPFFTPEARDFSSRSNATSIKSMPWSQAPDAFKRPEAGWRRMLVTQPPVQKIVISETCQGSSGDSERRGVLENQQLRMETLFDITQPLINRLASSFCLRWHADADDDCGRITLAVVYTRQQGMVPICVLDMRLYRTEIPHKMEPLEFGEWSQSLPKISDEAQSHDSRSVNPHDYGATHAMRPPCTITVRFVSVSPERVSVSTSARTPPSRLTHAPRTFTNATGPVALRPASGGIHHRLTFPYAHPTYFLPEIKPTSEGQFFSEAMQT
ncbi:hypothetical protein K438DRAFT_2008648 [Mycena galopus ATCC 62051]|nr:hypothetical protein K438DRAFT_2008648 [Mycena galopus ATCC 62051]